MQPLLEDEVSHVEAGDCSDFQDIKGVMLMYHLPVVVQDWQWTNFGYCFTVQTISILKYLLQLPIENSLIIKISLTTFNSSNSSISSINLQGETKHHQLHLLISDFTNLLDLEFLSTFELFNPLVPDKKH